MASLSQQVLAVRQGNVDISTLSVKALSLAAAIDYSTKVAPVEFFFEGDKLPHFRCPPGTRRAGKWTDKLGTDCELGGARVALARIGERMQRIAHSENARGDLPSIGERLEFRMNRMADRLNPRGERGGKRRGRGVATVLEDAADVLDGGRGRKRRGRGVATALEDAADVVDGGRGRKKPGRGVATALEDAANAVDGGKGQKPGRGVATALEDAADAIDGGKGKKRKTEGRLPRPKKKTRRGAATVMDDAADALDGGQGRRRNDGAPNITVRDRGENALIEGRRLNEQAQRVLLEEERRRRAAEGLDARTDVTAARSMPRLDLTPKDSSVARRRRRAPKYEDVIERDGKDITKFNEDELRAHRDVLDGELKDLQKQRNEARKRMRDPEGAGHGETVQIQDYNDQIEAKRAAIKIIDQQIEQVRRPAETKPGNDILPPNSPEKPKPAPKPRPRPKRPPRPKAPATPKEPSAVKPDSPKAPSGSRRPLDEIDKDLDGADRELKELDKLVDYWESEARRPPRRNPPPHVQSNLTEWRSAEQDRPEMARARARDFARQRDEKRREVEALRKERKDAEDAMKASLDASIERRMAEDAAGEASIPPATPPNPSGSTPKPSPKPKPKPKPKKPRQPKPKNPAGPENKGPRKMTYKEAEQHLKGGGDIGEVPDGLVVEAMLDSNLRIRGKAGTFRFQDVLTPDKRENPINKGWSAENDRFAFKCIKASNGYDVWHVFQVTDKKNGRVYFLKASTYGNNDAMLEKVGAQALDIHGFPVDPEGQVRLGGVMRFRNGKEVRWSLQPAVWDVYKGRYVGQKPDGKFKEVGEVAHERAFWVNNNGKGKVDPVELANLIMLDFLYQNEDRHAGNLMMYRGKDGYVNLAPIDQGLLFGGRIRAGNHRGMSPAAFEQQLADEFERIKDYDAKGYRRSPNNGAAMFRALVGKAEQNGRAYNRAEKKAMVDEITRLQEYYNTLNADEMFAPENFEKAGARLTQNERIHLEYMKRLFVARRETLNRLGPQGFLDQLMAGM